MFPPMFSVCNESPLVNTLLRGSDNILRIFAFGEAPQDVQRPYVVWQLLGGSPENYLDRRPDVDAFYTQLDVYADTAQEAREVAQSIRDAIEGVAYIVAYNSDGREPTTRLWRYSFDVDWYTYRA